MKSNELELPPCQGCAIQLVASSARDRWRTLSSAAALCTHDLTWFYRYYWQAIDQQSTCYFCGAAARLSVKAAQDLPSKYHGLGAQAGIAIACTHCGRTHYNTLSHLTFDLPQVRRFWHQNRHITWLQGEPVEHEGTPAFISTFRSKEQQKHIDVLVEQQTFRVLAINGY